MGTLRPAGDKCSAGSGILINDDSQVPFAAANGGFFVKPPAMAGRRVSLASGRHAL